MPKTVKGNSPSGPTDDPKDDDRDLVEDQKTHGYYYDDAHGYQRFEENEGEEDEPEDRKQPDRK